MELIGQLSKFKILSVLHKMAPDHRPEHGSKLHNDEIRTPENHINQLINGLNRFCDNHWSLDKCYEWQKMQLIDRRMQMTYD